jgi:hypothetical protein
MIAYSWVIGAQETIVSRWRRQKACPFVCFRDTRSRLAVSFAIVCIARLVCYIVVILLGAPKRNHAGQLRITMFYQENSNCGR